MKNRILSDLLLFLAVNALVAGLIAFALGGCRKAFEPPKQPEAPPMVDEPLAVEPARPEAPPTRGEEPAAPKVDAEARSIEGGIPSTENGAERRPAVSTNPRAAAKPAGERPAAAAKPAGERPAAAAKPAGERPAARPGNSARPGHEARPGAGEADGMVVVDKAAATAIVKRVPSNPGSTFDLSDLAVYAYVKVQNPGAATHVDMLWKKDGEQKWSYRLRIGEKTPGWRTWSRKRLTKHDTGKWTVEVRSPDGALLDTIGFRVEKDAALAARP